MRKGEKVRLLPRATINRTENCVAITREMEELMDRQSVLVVESVESRCVYARDEETGQAWYYMMGWFRQAGYTINWR